ncbi:MAG: lectin [Thermomonas sp.]
MRQTLLPIALSALVLAACSPDRGAATPETDATAPMAAGDTDAMPADSTPPSLPEPGEASDTPVSNASDGSDAQARFDGYGDVKLGTAAADMQAAWGGELKEVGKDFNADCYFMTPKWVKAPADFAFMVEGGKFVRYGTESVKFTAPGGGKIGMTKAEVAALYAGRIEEQPHKYSDGQYLRIKDSAGGSGVLIFETDAKGDAAKVTEWRVGTPPQVDYVEGCA